MLELCILVIALHLSHFPPCKYKVDNASVAAVFKGLSEYLNGCCILNHHRAKMGVSILFSLNHI